MIENKTARTTTKIIQYQILKKILYLKPKEKNSCKNKMANPLYQTNLPLVNMNLILYFTSSSLSVHIAQCHTTIIENRLRY